MAYVVDIQCFKRPYNEFVIKELAILPLQQDAHPLVYLFEPPYAWSRLPARYKCENRWLTNNYHGIDWAAGDVCYEELQPIIKEVLIGSSGSSKMPDDKLKTLQNDANHSEKTGDKEEKQASEIEALLKEAQLRADNVKHEEDLEKRIKDAEERIRRAKERQVQAKLAYQDVDRNLKHLQSQVRDTEKTATELEKDLTAYNKPPFNESYQSSRFPNQSTSSYVPDKYQPVQNSILPTQFQPPLCQPSHYQPSTYQSFQYHPPQYQSSQYDPPQYQPPQYQPPQYQPPQYQPPQYQPPQYQPPQYQPPQYQPPQNQPPQPQYLPPQPFQYQPSPINKDGQKDQITTHDLLQKELKTLKPKIQAIKLLGYANPCQYGTLHFYSQYPEG
ncbi:epsin-2-like [Leptopilina heterotoma]|uniref:epsin-2-like n=1 Tax=Leptopilina heterotoma TaxID=63436 RepID=UPI001CA9AB8E|nr:epsin-2-like [Leptopilina heterotoma]